MHCPYVVVAIDVETPGWDHAASFLGQNRHMGPPPCVVNHRQDKGAICQIGWCVFRRVGSGQYRYEQPHSVTVQLPARETISETLAPRRCMLPRCMLPGCFGALHEERVTPGVPSAMNTGCAGIPPEERPKGKVERNRTAPVKKSTCLHLSLIHI